MAQTYYGNEEDNEALPADQQDIKLSKGFMVHVATKLELYISKTLNKILNKANSCSGSCSNSGTNRVNTGSEE